jgi:predicted outer membrane repeat protein
VILQNNVFSGNLASQFGGGIYLRGTPSIPIPHPAVLFNNSFSGNKSNSGGGAIFILGINPVVTNSIFWNDSSNALFGPEIYLNGPDDTLEIANSNIDFNLVKGKTKDGDGNINEDPLFEDLTLLTLLTSSLCINAGIANYTCDCGETHTCPGYDIIGIPRPQSGGFEMGAHEVMFVGTPEVVSLQSSIVSYPNPFSNFTTFEYALEQSAKVNLSVYNHLGQQVAVVADEEQAAGLQQVRWEAEGLPSGIYFYRLTAGSQNSTGKMLVVR